MQDLEKALFLSKAKPINTAITISPSTEVSSLQFQLFINSFIQHFKIKRFHSEKYIKIFYNIIANAIHSNLISVSLSNRKKNNNTLKKVILFLIHKEYATKYTGYKNAYKSKKTRILFKPQFYQFIKDLNISAENIQRNNNDLIILKNEEKNIVEYNKSKKYNFLLNYNELLKQQIISIKNEIIPYSPIYRIFNQSKYSLGGRYYGSIIQNFPKSKRQDLLFNGRKTEEIDFPCLHISILYSFKNSSINIDAYYLKEYPDERSLIKFILIILLFSKSKEQAIKAILFKKYKNNSFYFNKINHIIDLLLEKHSLIKDLFFKPKLCLKLQNIESRIASMIIKHFTNKNIIIIPIHDGFICEQTHATKLKEIMIKSFFKQTKTQIIL